MAAPPKFLYQFEDSNGLSYYYLNGVLTKNSPASPLKNNPDGWADIQFEFDTNSTYFSLGRTVSTPFTFVKEGAKMLREKMYLGKGTSEVIYVRVLELSQVQVSPPLYSLCYYGQLDLTTFDNDTITGGVTVNTVEGGLKTLLSANDSTSYDILCSDNSLKWMKVYFDGTLLADSYNYSSFNISPTVINGLHTLPLIFLNNTGDSIGVISGNQALEQISDPSTIPTNTNYLIETTASPLTFPFKTNYKVTITCNRGAPAYYAVGYYIISGTTATYTELQRVTSPANGTYTFPVDVTITLPENSKFMFVGVEQFEFINSVQLSFDENSKASISFQSKNVPSSAYALRPIWLGQALLDKVTGVPGKYTFQSDYFTQNPNLITTCGDALRNTARTKDNTDSPVADYYIASSFQDFFTSYSIVPMGAVIQGNVFRMEPLSDLYGTGDTLFDLGEVSKVKIAPLKDKLINTLTLGSPDQTYEQKNGKYEFNSVQTWILPTKAVNNTLDLTSKYRRDCFGIEFLRSNYTGQDSSVSSGDKSAFQIDCVDLRMVDSQAFSAEGFNYNGSFVLSHADDAANYKVGDTFVLTNMLFNNGTFTVKSVDTNTGTIFVNETVGSGAIVENGTVSFKTLNLNRPAFTSITGVLDNTVYNVMISPAHIMRNWAAYWASLFYQQPADSIIQTHADKNNQLSTTVNGATVSENAALRIGSLESPIFLPYLISLTTEIKQTFYQIVNVIMNGGKGDIHARINNKDVYLLPLFCKMTAKPATGEGQDWQLVLSPRTSLLTLLSLSDSGFDITINDNSMYISDLQPLNWINYNYPKQSGIQQLQPWQDWEENRYPNWFSSVRYLQKWMTADTIKIWFVTSGISELTVYVYDRNAKLYGSYLMSTKTSSAISSPNLLKYVEIPLSSFDEGVYLFTVQAGATPYLISGWQYVRQYDSAEDDGTMIMKYSNSTNTLEYYQELGTIQLRVECTQGIPDPKGDLTTYVDDLETTVLLNGRTHEQRPYTFGYPTGVPDWMIKKLNLATALDTVSLDNFGVVRASDAQFDTNKIAGYNLAFTSIPLLAADNMGGRMIDDVTGDEVNDGGFVVVIDINGEGDTSAYQQIKIGG